MSCGIVICSKCYREVHQDGPKLASGRYGWNHCDDKTPLCEGAEVVFPSSRSAIKGKYCGRDE